MIHAPHIEAIYVNFKTDSCGFPAGYPVFLRALKLLIIPVAGSQGHHRDVYFQQGTI
jgi:hypothetical protein